MRKVTIEDISRDTGLSRGTVSRALNDRPDISERTKEKVLQTCRRLKYVPSHAARSLATGRNYALAVIVDDIRSSFNAGFLRGVISKAEAARYAVHVVEYSPESTRSLLAPTSQDLVDGVLVAAHLKLEPDDDLRPTLSGRVVTACWPIEGVECDVLAPDDIEAGRMVARLVVGAGLRSITYLENPAADGAADRLTGFQQICSESGIEPIVKTVTSSDWASEDVAERMRAADAVIASDDFTAISAMLLCERIGRRPGRDVAIVGHGDEPAAELVTPGLTTVDFDAVGIGRRAAEVCLDRLSNKSDHSPGLVRVAPKLVRRASTGHLRHSD